MPIEVIDSRIKTGVNVTVKNGITYFYVIFYCSSQSDLDDVIPSNLYEDAWWAHDYVDNNTITPKVLDYKITRIIPGASFPCLVEITAVDKVSTRFPSVDTGRYNLRNVVIKEFTYKPFTWLPKYFGMRKANSDDVLNGAKTYNISTDSWETANVGNLIFNNYKNYANKEGAPNLTECPCKISLTAVDAVKKVNSKENILQYNLKYYVSGKKLYKYAEFSGINGHFPHKYKPGIDDANDSKRWLANSNRVQLYIDNKGNYWCVIERSFIHTPKSATEWKGDEWSWIR